MSHLYYYFMGVLNYLSRRHIFYTKKNVHSFELIKYIDNNTNSISLKIKKDESVNKFTTLKLIV